MKYKDSAKNNCSYPSVRALRHILGTPTFLRHILGCASSVRAAQASHTRLRQLADFPSLILRCEPHRLLAIDEYRGTLAYLLPLE